MRTSRNIHHPDEAKVNAGILATVLFGLVIVGLSGLIIPGWEDYIPGEAVVPENRLALSQHSVIDDIGLQSLDAISEELENQKVRIESSQIGATKTQFVPEATIRGRAFVGSQGKAGIQVKIWRSYPSHRLETITDKDGFYKIKGLYEGEYRIQATFKDDEVVRTNKARNVRLKTNFTAEYDIYFEQRISLSGRIYLFGIPTEGVRVLLKGRKSNKKEYIQDKHCSRNDGFYRITNLIPDRYILFADLQGIDRRYYCELEIDLLQSKTMFDIHLGEEGAGEVFGYVYKNNQPEQSVHVSLHTDSIMANTTTDESGAYRFSCLPSSEINLWASLTIGNHYTDFITHKQFKLKRGESTRQDLHIATGSGVIFGEVRVNGSSNYDYVIRLKGETVTGVHSLPFSSTKRGAKLNEYHFTFLPAGRYELQMWRPLRIRRIVSLKANEELRVDFDIVTGLGYIIGTLKTPGVDGDSGSVSVYLFKPGMCPWRAGGSLIHPSFNEESVVTALTVRNGKFKQDNLPAGVFDVVAVRCDDGKILAMDIKPITLTKRVPKFISLDVTRY